MAKAVIGYLFDVRQKALYDANPSAAIRHLNRILKEMERKREEQAREKVFQY